MKIYKLHEEKFKIILDPGELNILQTNKGKMRSLIQGIIMRDDNIESFEIKEWHHTGNGVIFINANVYRYEKEIPVFTGTFSYLN